MPYADSDGVQIYYEVEGNPEGPPLVLQHGLTGYLESWRERGYTEVLGDDYRLILIDARGHGRSDKPHEPSAYVRELRAADVVSVLAIFLARAKENNPDGSFTIWRAMSPEVMEVVKPVWIISLMPSRVVLVTTSQYCCPKENSSSDLSAANCDPRMLISNP